MKNPKLLTAIAMTSFVASIGLNARANDLLDKAAKARKKGKTAKAKALRSEAGKYLAGGIAAFAAPVVAAKVMKWTTDKASDGTTVESRDIPPADVPASIRRPTAV